MARLQAFHYGCVDKRGFIYTIAEKGTGALKYNTKAVHIRKFDQEGNSLMDVAALTHGGTTSISKVAGIAVDDEGKIYLLATLIGGTTTNHPADTCMVFVFDDEGNHLRQKDIGVGTDAVEGIDVDAAGHVYIFSSGTTTVGFYKLDDELNIMLDAGSSL